MVGFRLRVGLGWVSHVVQAWFRIRFRAGLSPPGFLWGWGWFRVGLVGLVLV